MLRGKELLVLEKQGIIDLRHYGITQIEIDSRLNRLQNVVGTLAPKSVEN